MKKSSYLVKAYVEATIWNEDKASSTYEIVKVQVADTDRLNATLQAIRCIDEHIEFILDRKVTHHEIKRIMSCEKVNEGGR